MRDDRIPSLWSVSADTRLQAGSDCVRLHTTVRHGIASRIVTSFSAPESTVLDLYGGAGAVVRAAVECGRHVVALTAHRCCWEAARVEMNTMKRLGFCNDGMVITPSRRQPATLLPKVDLLLLGLGTGPRQQAIDEMLALLRDFSVVLAPGGYAAVVTPPVRLTRQQVLLDVPTRVAQTGRLVGLMPMARLVVEPDAGEPETITVLRTAAVAAARAGAMSHWRSWPGPSMVGVAA